MKSRTPTNRLTQDPGRHASHRSPSSIRRPRTPLDHPPGRPLRILIYARYSTDEQDERSIPAQFQECERFLREAGCDEVEIVRLSDDGISGELLSRPGIDEARRIIDDREVDAILSEDLSRLFRNVVGGMQFVGAAVDNDIRVLCPNDRFDTAEKDWDDRLCDALRHHSRSNSYTADRIKRAARYRFEQGYAMGPLRSGYLREDVDSGGRYRSVRGPYMDRVDEAWRGTINELFERVATGERLEEVARWLDKVGLPKTNQCADGKWTKTRVLSLIRCPTYRGEEQFRQCRSVKQHRTGKHRQIRNAPEEVLVRPMERLRIVPDWLWHNANKAIDDRARGQNRPRGAAHPLYGLSRDSFSALSGMFFCNICGSIMHQEGRNEGGYRCSGARRGTCWNRTTALRDLAHKQIADAVRSALGHADEQIGELARQVDGMLSDDGSRDARLAEAKQRVIELCGRCDRLLEGIEMGSDDAPPSVLVDRLRQCEGELARAQADVEQLQAQQHAERPPTVAELQSERDLIVAELATLTRENRGALNRVVSRITAVPCQLLGGNKVVLRARFDISLAGLLSPSTRLALQAVCDRPVGDVLSSIAVEVDLFESAEYVRHAFDIRRLRDQEKLAFGEIADRLGMNIQNSHRAVKFGRKLHDAGRTDPYVELSECPANASRWRVQEHLKPGGVAAEQAALTR